MQVYDKPVDSDICILINEISFFVVSLLHKLIPWLIAI